MGNTKDKKMGRHDNRCANTEALNRHLAEEDKASEALEDFMGEIQSHLDMIDESYFKIREKAKEYTGYNFEEEIDDALIDIIYPSKHKENIKKLSEIRDDMLKMIGKM